jgi:hypothetical protein
MRVRNNRIEIFYGGAHNIVKNLRTFFLMTFLTLMLLFLGNLIGGRSGMTIALIFSFLMNFYLLPFSCRR